MSDNILGGSSSGIFQGLLTQIRYGVFIWNMLWFLHLDSLWFLHLEYAMVSSPRFVMVSSSGIFQGFFTQNILWGVIYLEYSRGYSPRFIMVSSSGIILIPEMSNKTIYQLPKFIQFIIPREMSYKTIYESFLFTTIPKKIRIDYSL